MFKILEKLTAKNKKQDNIRMPSHLSAAEQKQVQTVIDRARGDRTVPHSAQESIPFQRMFPDGICRVTDNYYTKTIQSVSYTHLDVYKRQGIWRNPDQNERTKGSDTPL